MEEASIVDAFETVQLALAQQEHLKAVCLSLEHLEVAVAEIAAFRPSFPFLEEVAVVGGEVEAAAAVEVVG